MIETRTAAYEPTTTPALPAAQPGTSPAALAPAVPAQADPYLPDDADLADERLLLWAFITAPTDAARHIARHLKAADFYQPSHADLYRVAIAARRTSRGQPGAEHVMDAIDTVMNSETERHRKLVRDLLIALVGTDVDHDRITEYASTVLHLAMRRQVMNHAHRIVQITQQAQPDELHTLIAEAAAKLLDTGLEQRYRNLNGHPA